MKKLLFMAAFALPAVAFTACSDDDDDGGGGGGINASYLEGVWVMTHSQNHGVDSSGDSTVVEEYDCPFDPAHPEDYGSDNEHEGKVVLFTKKSGNDWWRYDWYSWSEYKDCENNGFYLRSPDLFVITGNKIYFAPYGGYGDILELTKNTLKVKWWDYREERDTDYDIRDYVKVE